MTVLSRSFWDAHVDDLKNGFKYIEKSGEYECLLCGKTFEDGIVYQENGVYYEARKFIKIHIEKDHVSVFEFLLNMDKKHNGVTEHQRNILRLFRAGLPDAEISEKLGNISVSTVRNHRFVLREFEKQAKIFLALMQLASVKGVEKAARNDKTRRKSVENEGAPLARLPKRHEDRLAIYESTAKRFDPERKYTEKEVNEILKTVYFDHAFLRRVLVDYKFLARKVDGSLYWVINETENTPVKTEVKKMDKRKELKAAYKETKSIAGIYCFKNTENGMLLIGRSLNLNSARNRIAFELETGKLFNGIHEKLLADWKKYGKDKFVFEILEKIKEDDIDPPKTLEKLEKKWIDKLKPFGQKGYNDEL